MTDTEFLTKIITETAGEDAFQIYSKNIEDIYQFLLAHDGALWAFGKFFERNNGETDQKKTTSLDIMTKGSTKMTYELRVIDPNEGIFYEVL